MRITVLRHLAAICLATLICGQCISGEGQTNRDSSGRTSNETAWLSLAPEGDEFVVMIPAPPTFRVFPANYLIRKDGEKVLEHREYSGYGNGLIFVIQSFKAARPQNLWGPLLENADQSDEFERDLKLDGVVARQYRSTYSKFPRHTVRLVTKQHVYFLTVITLEEESPAAEQFLSSFRLRRDGEKAVEKYSYESGENVAGEVFKPSEVTRKAIVVWKPEPTYTELARKHQLVGTIHIEAVLGASGYVTNIKVTKELGDGMTENAIEATRNIRFFPAMKDGKAVSQRMVLEYNFNLF